MTGTYYFVDQSNAPHGYLFYGTDFTIQALVQIANVFYNAQIACANGASAPGVLHLQAGYSPNAYNTDPVTNAPRTYTTPGTPKRLRITAMSLPWGGLNDVYGSWGPPHATHSTGRVADLGWSDFQVKNADPKPAWYMDLIYLLGAVILSTPGASMPYSGEGGDLDKTLQDFTGTKTATTEGAANAHFHVQFSS